MLSPEFQPAHFVEGVGVGGFVLVLDFQPLALSVVDKSSRRSKV